MQEEFKLEILRFLYKKGCQGTCIKDTWTKPKGLGWRWEAGMGGAWGSGGGEMETMYLNNNKKYNQKKGICHKRKQSWGETRYRASVNIIYFLKESNKYQMKTVLISF